MEGDRAAPPDVESELFDGTQIPEINFGDAVEFPSTEDSDEDK